MKQVKEPFETVYEKCFSDIYNYVYAQLLNRERTEDMVSVIFLKAFTGYERYDPSKASERTWLTRIARNALIDEYRSGRDRENISLDDEENGMEDPSVTDEYGIFQEEREKEVCRILAQLSVAERELIGMIYFEDMKNEEIGSILGIKPKAVSERHRRLLQKCRNLEKGKKFSDFF